MFRPTLCALFATLALAACTAPATAPPADAGVDLAPTNDLLAPDATSDIAPPRDVATDIADVSTTDAARTDVTADDVADALSSSGSDEILGTLRGTCGTIRGMLHSPTPSLIRNDLTFVATEQYLRSELSPGGQHLFDTANAGGSSAESEVMSYEVLHYCEGASFGASETEIHYAPPDDSGANSITDILVLIGGERVGVSVTRAYLPLPMVFTETNARELLTRKLVGINRSSMRVLPVDRWVKQILHVLAVDADAATQLEHAWASLDAATRADTIVLVTVTHGGGFVYCHPTPPLGSECPPLHP